MKKTQLDSTVRFRPSPPSVNAGECNSSATQGPVLALDLATVTGWASRSSATLNSGTISFKSGRFEGGGMRFLRFRKWLREIIETEKPEVIFFEEVRRHAGTDAAHVFGGLLAILTAECEAKEIAYQGVPVGTIKTKATGKGNASKDQMVAAAKAKWPDQNIESHDQADALWILETGVNL